MIPYGRHHIEDDDVAAVVDILKNGLLTQGPVVERFENAFRDRVHAKYAVAVSSGTAALHMAALAAGVGSGRALVTSPITFVASSNAALYAGGRPVLTDIDPETVNMSPDALAETLRQNPDVRAVVPVHFAGLPCDMPAIKRHADEAGAVVVEDAAHALGARYCDGSPVGCCKYSLMTVFSFHPVKAIATGEGGMVTTNDESVYRRLLRLRSHGINKLDDPFEIGEQSVTGGVPNLWYYEMQEIGFNYRITDIQCALGLSQLKKIDRFVDRRRALACTYDAAFTDFAHARPAQAGGRDRSGHHLYVLRIDYEAAGTTRAQLMRELRTRKIVTQVHYIPVAAHPFYQRMGLRREDHLNAEAYYREALSIPLFYGLTAEQQDFVLTTLQELLG
jgi:perosamine synthetase